MGGAGVGVVVLVLYKSVKGGGVGGASCHQASAGDEASATRLTVSSLLPLSETSEEM